MVNPKVVGLGALSAWEYNARSFPLKVVGVYLSSTEPNTPTNVQKLKVTLEWPTTKKGTIKLTVEHQEGNQSTEGYVSVVFKLNAPNLKPDMSEVKLFKVKEAQAKNQGGEA
jgi:predicted ATP-grasp superfamily ATP-dependent carboligase